MNVEVVQELGRRCADQEIATIDLDSTVIESWKREGQPTYEGGTGYQPKLALWAEMNVIVAEELRDGSVPTVQEPFGEAGLRGLAGDGRGAIFPGDAGCYEEKLLSCAGCGTSAGYGAIFQLAAGARAAADPGFRVSLLTFDF